MPIKIRKKVGMMPRGDGTGPNGLGSMTGRAAGYCRGYATPGFMNPSLGCGFGRGGSRGFRRGFRASGVPGWAGFSEFSAAEPPKSVCPARGPDSAIEVNMLTNQIEMMEQSLKNAKERLCELQKSGD